MGYGLDERRTIFALASGIGKSAVAVIRISGPSAAAAIRSVVGDLPAPRNAALRRIIDPNSLETLDRGLVLWFPGPSSFTGEDSAELHVHGARAVVVALLAALGKMSDLRPAKPGEFARRALENGKLDLIAIEALGDLIEAETELQRRLAVIQTEGHLRDRADQWRTRLIDALVIVESELDFSDESDAPRASEGEVKAICGEILQSLAPLAKENHSVERLREGLTVLIAGPPNAGKSTLLNTIAKRDVAIVSERAGTTRDLIEVKLDLGGFPVNLIDTAGIHASGDPVEREGIERAIKKSKSADLVLWLTPSDAPRAEPPKEFGGRALWSIRTKADSVGGLDVQDGQMAEAASARLEFGISATTGYNCDFLIKQLQSFAQENMSVEGSVVVANDRQRFAIRAAQEALTAALDGTAPLEILAEELRRACFSLESLVGKVGVEDVLDQLFSRFCIGK